MIDIKNIPPLPESIKNACNNKKLAIFIGAGVSRLIGCDGWDDLAKSLVNKCAEKNYIKFETRDSLLNESDNIKLISICDNIFTIKDDEESFMQLMRSSLKDHKVQEILDLYDKNYQIYRNLKNIGNLFITTNADRFFDKLFNPSNIFKKEIDLKLNNIDRNKLYKIHGCISERTSLVFTQIEYMTRYTNEEFDDFIKNFFGKYTVLFVGYGLKEFELLSKIMPNKDNNSGEPKHYFLHPCYKSEQELCNLESEYFSKLGIKLIPYSKDEKSYDQLIDVINDWYSTIQRNTLHLQNNFEGIIKALENSSSTEIAITVQNIKYDKVQASYFFSQACAYQNLHLWLKPLSDAGFFSFNGRREFQHNILNFLNHVSIQNKAEERQAITENLLLIVNKTIDNAQDDYIIYRIVEVLFNLSFQKITVDHIDLIGSHIKHNQRSFVSSEISTIIMPVLIKNNMKEHMLKLLPIIFGYEFREDTFKIISIIEEYHLGELLKRHSKEMVKLTGSDGLKIMVSIINDIVTEEKSIFNYVWLTVIRTKTEDEIEQNRHADRYDNQLIFFTRDLFESNLPNEIIKPYIENFLLIQDHPIFIRLALHVINYKYHELKDIFWQWMNLNVQYNRKELELWTLLNERAEDFTGEEFDKLIEWIETFDYRKLDLDDRFDDRDIELRNAYRRKEYLLCLKDYSEKAENLYQEYHLIEDSEVKHPGFSYWSYGVRAVPRYSYPDTKKLCKDPIETIQNFNPSEVNRRSNFDSDEDIKRGFANDLSTCVTNNPKKFVDIVYDFQELEYIYKEKLIQGFANAWRDKQSFEWDKVLGFINNELSDDFLNSDDSERQCFVSEIANLIQCGTEDDGNAFDKDSLPEAKKILLRLVDNKYEESEDGTYSSLTSHVLNSTNGKVLHALMDYACRYGRLNSSLPVKWEPEIKKFFTNQLKENSIYSESVFTILGTYIHQLQYLDHKWTVDNFNKIFPLENKKLWGCSITAYFFHLSILYEEMYNLFKAHGHINQILHTDFEEYEVKSKFISITCIAYIDGIDNETLIDNIHSKNKNFTIEVVCSVFQLYYDNDIRPYNIKEKIQTIWVEIYKTYKDDNSDDVKKIFKELCDWFVFLDEIKPEDIELLKYTVEYAGKNHPSHHLIEAMAGLSSDYPEDIAELYICMLENDIYPIYEEEYIKQICNNVGKVNKSKQLEIQNLHRVKGIFTNMEFNE